LSLANKGGDVCCYREDISKGANPDKNHAGLPAQRRQYLDKAKLVISLGETTD